MARKRTRTYETGDKIQVSLNKDLSPEFLEWINKQSDLTNFFLYSAQQLYKQTGNIDVATVMPRKIDIEHINPVPIIETQEEIKPLEKEQKEFKQPVETNDVEQSDKVHDWNELKNKKFEGDHFS